MTFFRKSLTTIAILSSARAFSVTPKTAVTRAATRTFATQTNGATTSSKVASDELLNLINDQVTKELTASQLYLSASIWCESRDLSGMAEYFRSESLEERSHAMGFIDFAKKRDMPIKLQALDAPKTGWNNVQELWEHLLDAEKENTQSLLNLGDVAAECSDHATTAFLMPYHTEQVESEDNLRKIIAKIRDEKETPGLLRQLDSSLEEEAASAN